MPNLNEIDEEDEDYYNEVFIDELENGNMGEQLDKAEQFVDDFHSKRIDTACPSAHGYLLWKWGTSYNAFNAFRQKYILLESN